MTGRPGWWRGRPVWVLTLGRPLRVRVCGLCAALVVADGREQHDRHHTRRD